MTSTKETSKPRLRRLATFTAAIGMLVMSSGVALMVSASPASAANKVGICHATGSDTNPYTFISVDDDSVKLQGHLAHKLTPNKTWKNATTFHGVLHPAGSPKPDLIGSFTDDQGVFHAYDGVITAADCAGAVAVVEATADVDFTDPSCANRNVVSYDTTGSHVTFAVTSGSTDPGVDITVTATADPGTQFDDGTTTMNFTHHFGPAVDLNAAPCATANSTATVSYVDPTCANANAASYTTAGDHVTFALTSGLPAPGATIQVTATADAGHTFGDLKSVKVFTHKFDDALDLNGPPCQVVAPPVADATATALFVDPTCANRNDASYTTSGDHVTFAVTSGSAAPGKDIEVTATAAAGHAFADLSTTQVFTHTFGDAVDLTADPCVVTVVEPPVAGTPVAGTPVVDAPAAEQPSVVRVVTPSVVHAGLVSDVLSPDRGTQGLVLLAAGMTLMVLAGGLAMPTGRARS